MRVGCISSPLRSHTHHNTTTTLAWLPSTSSHAVWLVCLCFLEKILENVRKEWEIFSCVSWECEEINWLLSYCGKSYLLSQERQLNISHPFLTFSKRFSPRHTSTQAKPHIISPQSLFSSCGSLYHFMEWQGCGVGNVQRVVQDTLVMKEPPSIGISGVLHTETRPKLPRYYHVITTFLPRSYLVITTLLPRCYWQCNNVVITW